MKLFASKLGFMAAAAIVTSYVSAGAQTAAPADAPVTWDAPAAVQAIATQPNVFQTRRYETKALPTFSEGRDQLPQPVIAAHPEWGTLYWKAWELAFQHLMQPEPKSGFEGQLPRLPVKRPPLRVVGNHGLGQLIPALGEC